MVSDNKNTSGVAPHLLGCALIAAAISAHAWVGWQQTQPADAADFGGTGGLVAVSLAGGLIYYGTLAEVRQSFIKLEGVYYVQSFTNPANNQTENRVVNRGKADWHGPQWMVVPRDKIAFVEGVGAASRLGQLIAQEKQQAAASAPR